MDETIFKRLNYCMAYYPELWTEECLERDIPYFRELGVNCVRIMEFAWDMLEPEPGRFEFGYFDKLIARLAQEGISVIIGTPTAAPPSWFTHANPDALYVTARGERMYHGIREHICVNNDAFRERTRLLVERMAAHFGDNPNVIAWQIHNEFNWPVRECFCPDCIRKWKDWLKLRYRTVDGLNRELCAGIWSQTYFSLDEVDPPYEMTTPGFSTCANPCLKNLYIEYNRETVADYCRMQAEIIRKFSPAPITTNVNRVFHLGFEKLFSSLDFVAFDEYWGQDRFEEFLLDCDLWRRLCDKPFFLMETAVSHGGGVMGGAANAHLPGYVRAEAAANFLAGSCGFGFWLFRQHRAGMEQVHGHVISAWGERTAYYQGALDVGNIAAELADFVGKTRPAKAETALLCLDASRRIFEGESLGEVDYLADFLGCYRSMLSTGLYRDVLFEDKLTTDYRLVYIPFAPYLAETLLGKIREIAERGGTVVVGPHAGTREEWGGVHTDRCLGGLEALLGIRAKYYTSLDRHGSFGTLFGERFALSGYSIVMERTEHTLCPISGGWCDGDSVIEEVPLGAGRVVVCGTKLSESQTTKLLERYAPEREAEFGFGAAYFVRERMENPEDRYHCLVNMTGADMPVRLFGRECVLAPGEVWIESERRGF